MLNRTGWLVLALTGLPVGLAAQTPLITQAVDSGALIRMTVDSQRPARGRLTKRLDPADQFIYFCRYPGSCRVPEDSLAFRQLTAARLRKLEVQGGTHAPKYGAIALLLGTAAGYALGRQVKTNCDFTCRTNETSYAITGAAIGGLLGVGLGLALPTWRQPR